VSILGGNSGGGGNGGRSSPSGGGGGDAYESEVPTGLSAADTKTLKWYSTDDGYSNMNKYLATGETKYKSGEFSPKSLDKTVSKMDTAFKNAALKNDATVYRGLNENAAKQFLSAKKGDIIKSKTFLSTSSSKDIAMEFSKSTKTPKTYVMEVKLSKGTSAMSMKGKAHFDREKEVLVNRNTNLKMKGTRTEGSTTIIMMET